MSLSPTADEIKQVAHSVVRVLTARGLKTCLFGGAACYLYGNSRTPNDVDIVVLTSNHTTEDLKLFISRADPSTFYLRPSKKVGETYKILWARLRGNVFYTRRSCKVDILIPGILNIPSVPHHLVINLNNLPVMPIIPLLMLKLQGWEDHRLSSRFDMQQKQYVDIRDISQLLQVAINRGETLQDELVWLPEEFIDAGRVRLAKYLEILRPTNAGSWKVVGFEVNEQYL
ncbi:hypothetical protein BDY19DRAFT_994295 [Irpex rosettiformis]|uniref:Uncharacterized protein n=1 Tax=Irpex rosettiformis TaxID=378272 RepID=A0ACB8U284_9APHY|nr:hypothetical protein BDY19DRAFT_994295 [Irpex rosettiformis]